MESSEDLLKPEPSSPEELLLKTSKSSTSESDNATSSISFSSVYTDDEDSGHCSSSVSYKDRRREAHTQAEQKRRDSIKKGYDSLQEMVPTCQQLDFVSGYKLSKATILQRSIEYIQYLVQQKKKQEEELEALKKEVIALHIMKSNYEQIVEAHEKAPKSPGMKVSEDVKFQLLQAMMDTLYESFSSSVSVANFTELSGCVFTWLEEHCKPQSLHELVVQILGQLSVQSS